MLQTLAADVRYAVRVLGRTPVVHARRRRRARPRHRRHHRDLQHREHRAAAAAAVRRAGCAWCGCSTCRRRPRSRASRASRCRRPTSTTGSARPRRSRGWRCIARRSFTLTGSGAPRAIVAAAVGAGFFDVVRGQAGAGPAVPPGRGRARRARRRDRATASGAPQLGGGERARPQPDARRRELHDRRRDAGRRLAGVLVSDVPRPVGAAGAHRRGARRPREPQPAGGGAPAAGRRRRRGPVASWR